MMKLKKMVKPEQYAVENEVLMVMKEGTPKMKMNLPSSPSLHADVDDADVGNAAVGVPVAFYQLQT